MKAFLVIAVGNALMLATRVSCAADGHMMDGGAWGGSWMGGYGVMGGYAGVWIPTLLVIAVVALVAWVVMQKRK
jgi:uncharacterized membrane protein